MSRSASYLAILTAILSILTLSGCHSGNAVATANYPVPNSVSLAPTPSISLELGASGQFSASASNASNQAITEPISYASSNQAVVTVAANGLACAGSWDSLTAPQICTPGQVGTAIVTATAQGVTSPSTTVYVHQHIDHITISPVAAQPPPLSTTCFSAGQTQNNTKGEVYNFQANAFSGNGSDITSSVGIFSWQSANAAVATLKTATISSPIQGLLPGQLQTTANVPGTTMIYATVDNVNSEPLTYTTCPVQSISTEIQGGLGTSLTVPAGTHSLTLTATAIDSLGMKLYGIPLTWCTSAPTSITVGATACTTNASSTTAQYSGTVNVNPSQIGDAAIIAACTPPNCNIGFLPTQPVYPQNVVNIVATAVSGGGSTSETGTFYVSSSDCGTTSGCISEIYSITASNNQLGDSPAILSSTPNGLTFNPSGSEILIGTNYSYNNSQGFMLYTPGSGVSRDQGATGKVIAVSPDGNTVLVSDTLNTPSQIFVINIATQSSTALPISGATAAAFSPDSLKAFILAGNTLYVYSRLDALQTIPLPNAATAAAFSPEGGFAFLSGGGIATGLSTFTTCTAAPGPTIATNSAPSFVLPLPDATQVLVLDPPNMDIITVNAGSIPPFTFPSCMPPVTLADTSSINLGLGNFTPTQMLLSPDGTKAYIISSQLSSIVVFDIIGQTTSAFALTGNTSPVQAAISADGDILAVAATDGTVHMINTIAGGDITQITFPQNLCVNTAGQPYSSTCKPNLIVGKP